MTKQNSDSIESLLKLKKTAAPSDGFWSECFDPGFSRKMMVALSRPRRPSRAWSVLGWGFSILFSGVVVVTFVVAWMFSPQRAIASWEKSVKGREYVVDSLHSSQLTSYKIETVQDALLGEPTGGTTAYRFTSGTSGEGQF
jgi:hypothetical protein